MCDACVDGVPSCLFFFVVSVVAIYDGGVRGGGGWCVVLGCGKWFCGTWCEEAWRVM